MNSRENLLVKNNVTALCSTITVTYDLKNGSWRGFVLPYDVTFEADSKEEVLSVLKNMVSSYEEGLAKYDNAPHLKKVPVLSSKDDSKKWNEISMDVVNNILTKKLKIRGADYYAEAKLPA